MDTLPIIRDEGGELEIGATFDFGTCKTGKMPPEMESIQKFEERCDQLEFGVAIVNSNIDVRKFFAIPAGLCLKMKSGETTCHRIGDYLKDVPTFEERYEVLLMIRRTKAYTYIKPEDLAETLGASAKIFQNFASHIVYKVTHGCELLVKIKCEREPACIDESKTGLEALLLSLDDIAETCYQKHQSIITCFCSQTLHNAPGTIADLKTRLQSSSGLDNVDGAFYPIQCVLKPVENLNLSNVDLYSCNEDASITNILGDLEDQFDDLKRASRCLKDQCESGHVLNEEGEEKLASATEHIENLNERFEVAIGNINKLDKITKATDKYKAIIKTVAKVPTMLEWCTNIIMAETRRLEEMMDRHTLSINRDIPPLKGIIELRVVLVGKTGSGKSATGNTLLGRQGAFIEQRSSHSITQTCKEEQVQTDTILLRIIDTPGLFDTKRNMVDVRNELARVLLTFPDGIHAFIFVMNAVSRYTQEEKDAVKEIHGRFGDSVLDHCILLLTHADTEFKDESLRAFLDVLKEDDEHNDNGNSLLSLIQRMHYRVMGFSNLKEASQNMRLKQRNALVTIIYRLMHDNKSTVYSNEHFNDAKQIQADMELAEKERENKQRKYLLKTFDKHQLKGKEVTREVIAEFMKPLGDDELDSLSAKAVERVVRERLSKKVPETFSYLENIYGKEANNEKLFDIVQKEIVLAKKEHLKGKDVGKAHKELRGIVEKYVAKAWVEIERRTFDTQIAITKIKEKMTNNALLYCGNDDISNALREEIESERLAILTKMKIKAMTENLHKHLKAEIEKYIKNVTGSNLQQDKANNFETAINTIIPLVNNKLNAEEMKYFKDDTIAAEGLRYIKENEEALKKLSKCFPADSIIMTAKGPSILQHLKVGDKVLTSNQIGELCYESVILFTRAVFDQKAPYIVIKTTNGMSLALSHEHLLPIGQLSRLQPARSVVPGDKVFIANEGADSPQLAEVDTVIEEWREGIYCPHTTGGSIVVNGVLVSCFTTRFSLRVSHLLMVPVRLLFRFLPTSWFNAIPYSSKLGMPSVLAKLRDFVL